MTRRPTIIEFTGTPNAGKTTLLKLLRDNLPNLGLNASVKQEDAELVPTSIPKKTLERNFWITMGQLQSLVECKFEDYDIIFLDRGFYDAIFWARLLLKQGVCTFDASDFLIRLLNESDSMLNLKPDYLFVFDVDPKESIKRRMAEKPDATMTMSNTAFLEEYRAELNEFIKDVDIPVFGFDTTHMDSNEVLEATLKKLKEIL